MLRGRAVQFLYDDQGRETDAVLPAAGALDGDGVPGAVPGMTISKGQWHKLVALESGMTEVAMPHNFYISLQMKRNYVSLYL